MTTQSSAPKQSTDKARPAEQSGQHPDALAQEQSSVLSNARLVADPRTMSPGAMMQLQRTIGNQAVGQILAAQRQPAPLPPPVQRQPARTSMPGFLRPIQRVKDAFQAKLAKKDLKTKSKFEGRHVAADSKGAETTTNNRFEANDMPGPMLQGKMSNTVATSDAWINALEASDSVIDTDNGKWTTDVDISIDGWGVKWKPSTQTYETTATSGMKLKAGGYSEAIYKGKTKEVIGGQFIIDHVQNG